jgi:hypothetical protein
MQILLVQNNRVMNPDLSAPDSTRFGNSAFSGQGFATDFLALEHQARRSRITR